MSRRPGPYAASLSQVEAATPRGPHSFLFDARNECGTTHASNEVSLILLIENRAQGAHALRGGCSESE